VNDNRNEIKAILNTAIEAAQVAASILVKGFGSKLNITQKGLVDPVTNIDFKSEKAVRRVIAGRFPDHSIMAEEGDLKEGPAGYRWYVDPLDGTVNYIHRHPYFAVSIACARIAPGQVSEILAGVVLAPVLGEMFWASKGAGAYVVRVLAGGKGRQKLSVSQISTLMEAQAAVGYPYDFHQRPQEILEPIDQLSLKLSGIRHNGSAALDLAFVAAGRSEAYFEPGLKPWDVAAGIILVTEAGGTVTDRFGQPYHLESGSDLLAANGILTPELVSIIGQKPQ
jgi:myo-inositol-1(or 4)-monophosphatase